MSKKRYFKKGINKKQVLHKVGNDIKTELRLRQI